MKFENGRISLGRKSVSKLKTSRTLCESTRYEVWKLSLWVEANGSCLEPRQTLEREHDGVRAEGCSGSRRLSFGVWKVRDMLVRPIDGSGRLVGCLDRTHNYLGSHTRDRMAEAATAHHRGPVGAFDPSPGDQRPLKLKPHPDESCSCSLHQCSIRQPLSARIWGQRATLASGGRKIGWPPVLRGFESPMPVIEM